MATLPLTLSLIAPVANAQNCDSLWDPNPVIGRVTAIKCASAHPGIVPTQLASVGSSQSSYAFTHRWRTHYVAIGATNAFGGSMLTPCF
jgi:hypothetical protein